MICLKVITGLMLLFSMTESFNREFTGVAFSPYNKYWEGNKIPFWNSYSVDDIKAMLNVIKGLFTDISTYGMGVAGYNRNNRWDQRDSNCLVARAAAQVNREDNKLSIRVAQGIYQLDDGDLQKQEIDNAFSAAQDANGIFPNTVWAVTFTNEYFTNEWTGNRILNMIRDNKWRAQQLGLKVGTRIHVCGIIHENGGPKRDILVNIVKESDYIMCNLYPAKELGNSIQNAVNGVGNAYHSYVQKFKQINPNIQVIIGETGWPSQGVSFNQPALGNTPQNLKDYWRAMDNWASNNRAKVYMFEAINEPWKANINSNDWNAFNGPNGAEAHYGWWKRINNQQNWFSEI